jgi:hypothetical protein
MRDMKHTLWLALLASCAVHAQDPPNYVCTIEHLQSISARSEKVVAMLNREYLKKEFTVERRTGLMSGVLKNSYITRPEVIDLGSSENSYKVVTTLRKNQGAGAGSNIHALVVNEYDKGSTKPFVFMDNGDLFLGTCVHTSK